MVKHTLVKNSAGEQTAEKHLCLAISRRRFQFPLQTLGSLAIPSSRKLQTQHHGIPVQETEPWPAKYRLVFFIILKKIPIVQDILPKTAHGGAILNYHHSYKVTDYSVHSVNTGHGCILSSYFSKPSSEGFFGEDAFSVNRCHQTHYRITDW